MYSLSAESCNGECEDLMEAVKEGGRAPTAANESEWGVGEERQKMGQQGLRKGSVNTDKHLNSPYETRTFPFEYLAKLDAHF